MPFDMQLVHDLLINLRSNNHHLISRCCRGNKTKNPGWPPIAAILDFRFLKFCLILTDFVGLELFFGSDLGATFKVGGRAD